MDEKDFMVRYDKGANKVKYFWDEGDAEGSAYCPTISFQGVGKMTFVCDDHTLVFTDPPLSWAPAPPAGEGERTMSGDGKTLVLTNQFRTMGQTKLTLYFKFEGQPVISDPIVINTPPTGEPPVT